MKSFCCTTHLTYRNSFTFDASLQAVVYFSVRVEKESLNFGILTTELFGNEVGPDGVPYVFAGESEMTEKETPGTSITESVVV